MSPSTSPRRPESRKDLGDFQTPPDLVARVLDALGPIGSRFGRVLEPTCGRGNFIAGLLARADCPEEVRGFEIQGEHAEAARAASAAASGPIVAIGTADVFDLDLASNIPWRTSGPLLVLGNLPWVTVAALGASSGVRTGPARSNSRRIRGIEAMTGSSNFDISEALWLKLIRELAPQRPTIALLGKSAVARALLKRVERDGLPIVEATLWQVDALRWFGASVDACLLRIEVGPGATVTQIPTYPDLSSLEPAAVLGLRGGDLIADVAAYERSRFADGASPLTWRQGVKHDAADLMELIPGDDGRPSNKMGDVVDVEGEHIYPILKATDLAGGLRPRPARSVIVTQHRLGDDTEALASTAPRLWAYLSGHSDRFEARKSSIYRGRPRFSMFGIGAYSFAPHKVAISGLHKSPRFRAIGPTGGRPTLLDDTCYFLPCRGPDQAELLASVLNGPEAMDLIRALVFRDAKRPITQAVLRRLDLRALVDRAGLGDRWREDWASDWSPAPRTTAS